MAVGVSGYSKDNVADLKLPGGGMKMSQIILVCYMCSWLYLILFDHFFLSFIQMVY